MHAQQPFAAEAHRRHLQHARTAGTYRPQQALASRNAPTEGANAAAMPTVWTGYTTDAGDEQDRKAAAAQVANVGVPAVIKALGITGWQVDGTVPTPAAGASAPQLPLRFDKPAEAALRRLKDRARRTGSDLVELFLNGDIDDWAGFICNSFSKGMSLHLQGDTVKQHVSVVVMADVIEYQSLHSLCAGTPDGLSAAAMHQFLMPDAAAATVRGPTCSSGTRVCIAWVLGHLMGSAQQPCSSL